MLRPMGRCVGSGGGVLAALSWTLVFVYRVVGGAMGRRIETFWSSVVSEVRLVYCAKLMAGLICRVSNVTLVAACVG